jgi:hypothetical protein
MTTSLDDPVIIAVITTAAGEPAGPLLIDGCHRLYKAAVTGREYLPSLWLTAAETLAVRRPAALGPGRRRAGGTENRPGSLSLSGTTSPWTPKDGPPGCWTATSPATRWSASSPTRPRHRGRSSVNAA